MKLEITKDECLAMARREADAGDPDISVGPPMPVDAETVQVLLDLLNPLHRSVDKQIMDQVTDEREGPFRGSK